MKTPARCLSLVVLSALCVRPVMGQWCPASGTYFGPQQVITTQADGARSVQAADLDGDGDVLSASYLDECETWYGWSQDCNSNGVPDECEFSTLQAQHYCHCDTSAPCGNEDPGAGCANQSGGGALMSVCGSSTITDDDLVIRVENVSPQQFGLVFMGPGQQQVPFGNGQLCVGPGGLGVFRYPARNAGVAGVISEGPGLVAYSQASFGVFGTITPGQTWNFQGWYRDPFGPCGTSFNLSNAVAVTFGS